MPVDEPSGIPAAEPCAASAEPPAASLDPAEIPLAGDSPLPPIPTPDPAPAHAAWAQALTGDGPATAVAQTRAPRHRGRRLGVRAGALLALAGAVALIWVLLHSLLDRGHVKAVLPPAVVKVVIPEGETRMQIAQIAAADGLTGSYRAASRRSPLLDPAHYGAPVDTPNLEGFLFPATYDMYSGANVSTLVEEQLVAFQQNFGANGVRRAHELGVTPYGLLTVASMVEREAQTSHDRPLIAAVIYNRLHADMPLGIDATIYYAVELQLGVATYTHELTEAQLHIESPYNTRTHTGLPPTPVSNPGLASIEAAAHPAHVPYLYYVAGADGCGEQVFSTSEAAFERNVAAYKAAVQNNGGHPPVCKHK